jgi:hypothetical protein
MMPVFNNCPYSAFEPLLRWLWLLWCDIAASITGPFLSLSYSYFFLVLKSLKGWCVRVVSSGAGSDEYCRDDYNLGLICADKVD